MLAPKSPKRAFGNKGEQIAVELLTNKGYKIIEQNFSSRFGEIDIIALDGQTLVFVEVKTRKNLRFGLPQEAVTRQKLYRIRRTAEYYSLLHPDLPKKLRIDVVALVLSGSGLEYSKIIKVY